MKRFDGKVVVITGGTTGIGLSTAKAFLDEGARVFVTGRTEAAVAAAQAELGPRATALRSDTASLVDLDALAARLRADAGHVDVLFVNAGIAKFAPLEAGAPDLFDETFGINVRGAYFAVQKLLPLLRAPASVVLNTSVVASKGFAGTSIYSASKAALRSFARTLSAELLPRGIRVNAVSPGPITTPIYGKLGFDPAGLDAFEKQMAEQNPMKRFGRPEEVAQAVLFLASTGSSYVAGVDLTVDGGLAQL